MRGGRRQTRRNPAPNELSPARRNTQSFRTPESLNVSLAHPPNFLAQQGRDPAIPVTRMPQRQLMQPVP